MTWDDLQYLVDGNIFQDYDAFCNFVTLMPSDAKVYNNSDNKVLQLSTYISTGESFPNIGNDELAQELQSLYKSNSEFFISILKARVASLRHCFKQTPNKQYWDTDAPSTHTKRTGSIYALLRG